MTALCREEIAHLITTEGTFMISTRWVRGPSTTVVDRTIEAMEVSRDKVAMKEVAMIEVA